MRERAMRDARRFVLRVVARRLDAARAATHARRRRRARPVVPLEEVQRRVELLMVALYGRTVRVEPAHVVKPRGLARVATGARSLWRALRRGGDDRVVAPTLPVLDGDCVRLPRSLDAAEGRDAAVARYRLLAMEQAERLTRGTAAHLPADDALARDLYLVAEGAAVDRAVSARAPGVSAALAAARRSALAARPAPATLTGSALVVERLVQRALGALDDTRAGAPSDPLVHAAAAELETERTPEAARAWAYDLAARLRAIASTGAAHRDMHPVPFWGAAPIALPVAATTDDPLVADPSQPQQRNPLDLRLIPSKRAREARAGEANTQAGFTTRSSGGPAGPEDERGAEREVDDGSGNLQGDAAPRAGAPPATGGIEYPEWDHDAHQYRRDAVLVRELEPEVGSAAWADGVLAAHAALVRRVRARFEPLRANRARLGRQPRGDEIDLAAYVDGHAARLAGRGGDGDDERLYVAIRPARRALAILVLVDTSGSTDARVDGERQVIDVEKEAVLLASAALDALGDAYAVLTFSSRGARDVRVTTLKGFAEHDAALLRRRVDAVRPGANTRLGAALRHATALLSRQPAGHRLLLLLSDGRPNDSDGYQAEYAVEDARQAVHEARAQGVTPFCLTVDREAPEYLAHVFGVTGRTVLRRPEQLPMALVGVVRQLLGAGRV